ncbi:MAG: dTDP-4-dehydrorhamnose reductase [Syntrophales bacterium]
MKILLLGSEGMLGSELFAMLKSDHEVVGKDIQDFDIASADDCRRLVAAIRPDVVINAVAYTDVDGCEANRGKCFAVNAEGIKNLALACREGDIMIVHFSTDYVFAGDGNTPHREDDECQPLNVYGESKLAGEKYLQELSRNFLLIRTAWLYGPRGKNFVKTILEKAATVRTLKVVDDQIGSPTYTYDLAAAVKRLVEDRTTGIFHITNGGNCSWYEFSRAILQEAGVKDVEVLPVKSDEFPRPAKRPCFGVLAGTKFYQTTGITIRPWRMALRDCLSKTIGGKDKI